MRRRSKLQANALKVCQAVVDMTKHKLAPIQHWVMASEVQKRTGLSTADFSAAVEFAIETKTLESNRHRDSLAVHRERL